MERSERSARSTRVAVPFYVRVGRRAEVEQFAATLVEPYRQALAYAALGDKDRTFEALNRAVEIVPHRVAPLLMYPEMRLLRGDPRLDALRKKLNLPCAAIFSGLTRR